MSAGRTLYLRVGALAIAGLVLAVGFVLFLTTGRGGQLTIFETYSRESVQGLDVGAPVRYRGVQIGRVTQIALASGEYRRPEGSTFSEAFQLVVVRFGIDTTHLGDTPNIQDALRLGLRARIAAQGITGVNYVELDFVSPERFPLERPPWTPRHAVIPTIPSTVAQVRGAAEELISRLSTLPLDQIITDTAQVLANINRQTSEGGDVATALRETARAAGVLRAGIEAADLEGSLTELRRTAEAARLLIAGPELRAAVRGIAAASAELQRTATRLPGAVEGFERTMRTARETTVEVQSELIPILMDLRATTASLRATSEALRTSPSQFLLGAPPPPERRR